MKLTAAVTLLSLLGGLVLMVQAFPPKVKENPTPTIQWRSGVIARLHVDYVAHAVAVFDKDEVASVDPTDTLWPTQA